jgi:hypothetical protein
LNLFKLWGIKKMSQKKALEKINRIRLGVLESSEDEEGGLPASDNEDNKE